MQSQRINRRDFLKIAGLIGGSFVTAPKWRLSTSSIGTRPPWVHQIALSELAIKWDEIKPFDPRSAVLPNGENISQFVGLDEAQRLARTYRENQVSRIQKNLAGYSLKDVALRSAYATTRNLERYFLGPRLAPTPEERGVDRWKGTPEEAAAMLRTAMRAFGAAQVGFVALDDHTRKLLYSRDVDGKDIIFENCDYAYETDRQRVIPNKVRWVIVYSIQMDVDCVKTSPTSLAGQASYQGYERAREVQHFTQEFLRGLGYQCLGQAVLNGLGLPVAFAVLAGLGELSRANRLITPEYGPMVRLFILLTDLPVVVDHPIDAGIARFCRTCMKCAEACPAGAISFAEKPSYEIRGSWNNPGHSAYFEDAVKCYTFWREKAGGDCAICFSVCPFSKKNKAWIHELIKSTISEVPFINGFVRSMDDAFGYGAQKDPNEWWQRDRPEYGIEIDPF
jgi:reductive dehalogenase